MKRDMDLCRQILLQLEEREQGALDGLKSRCRIILQKKLRFTFGYLRRLA